MTPYRIAIYGAVLLAAVGQFGVIGTLVTHRSGEIGIRMAVGATARDVVALVVGQATAWTLTGALAGIAVGWWGARFLGSLLYGVKPGDLVSFGSALAILLAVSILAGWAPARRAARLDPARLLRQE